MAPDEEYQLTPAGRRERIGQIVRLVKKYRVWDNLTPVRLRRLLEELGPMFVKMGQILANRSEILPQRFCDELRRLRSDVDGFLRAPETAASTSSTTAVSSPKGS